MIEAVEPPARLQSVEGARGLLALWVVFGHLLQKSFPGEHMAWPLSLIRDAARPVDVFIIISGFVITELLLTKREGYAEFIVRRFFRLAPLLYVTIGAVFALYVLFPSVYGKYAQVQPLWGHLLSHLTMLHGAVPQEVMKNAQFTLMSTAWSISLEWQFYLVAPLLLTLRRPAVVLAGIAALVLGAEALRPILDGAGVTLGGAFLPYSLKLFMLGIASCLAFRALRPHWAVPGVALAAMLMAYAFTHGYAIAIWLLILLSVCGDPLPRLVLESRPVLWLGKISYSVYLLHMIAVTAGMSLLAAAGLSPGSFTYFAFLASITLGLALPASAVTYRFVEQPGMRVGKRLGASLRKQAPPAPTLAPAT